jgi:3-hydroxyacyl-[acyl-carrier-protein] dehydratase
MSRADALRNASLTLGSNVVELLLPQRRPMLMVDRIDCFSDGPPPALSSSRQVSANEIFFDGHFPGLHLWPGCLTIEGMGQTGQLLMALLAIRALYEADGEDPRAAHEALLNLELGFRMHPGYRPEEAERFRARMQGSLAPSFAVGAAVDVKLLAPVFAGHRLDYKATLQARLSDMVRFEVEASVEGTPVARGKMTGALVRTPVPRS